VLGRGGVKRRNVFSKGQNFFQRRRITDGRRMLLDDVSKMVRRGPATSRSW
jgi:hypothetical protein